MRALLTGDLTERTLHLAAVRAAALDRPVLAVLPLTTPYIDPIEWLRLELARDEAGFFLGSPAQREEFAGAGLAHVIEAGQTEPFEETREKLTALWDEAIFALPFLRKVARAFCAFAFSREDAPGPWHRIPKNLCLIPERMITRRRGTVLGARMAMVSPGAGVLAPALNASAANGCVAGWTHQQWLERSAQAISRIRAGELEKLVLVRRETHALDGDVDTPGLIEDLRARFPRCTSYWVRLGEHASFVGATPERLVRVSGRRVSTMALAGTIPNDGRADDARLLGSAKNRHEQSLVVREILETLQGLCTHVRVPDEPRVLRLGNVCHLQSNIAARLPTERHILDLVAALHPTPAVGGLPRTAAADAITEIEPEGRGWYAGPLGWCDAAGEGEFFVALRAALLTPGAAHLQAGCGLVAASDPEDEWQETGWKMKAVGEALAKYEC